MIRFNYLYIFLLIILVCGCTAQNGDITAETIISNITEPLIPEFSVNLIDFGATDDANSDDLPAFQKAITAIENNGGGKIIVPKGNYLLNGPIHLVSNLELHLQKGSHLFFSSNPKHFLPVVKTSWEGTFLYNYSPFIYAYQCSNIAITGEGIIDGQASNTWNNWKKKQEESQLLSREMNHNNTPVIQRVFGEGHFLRPQFIQFFECNTIKVEDITITDSPFWCLHLLKCENAIVRGVHYDAYNYNNDGIDPEYSKNILIENIHFNNSDDNVAIKAGRDNEGRNTAHGSQNIVVRNCHFKGLHALVIGSEMSAGVQNIFVQNCDYAGKLKRGIYLKSNPDRGGFIKNIFIENIDFGELEDCIYITSFYHNEGKGHVTKIDNINIKNLTCKRATGTGIVIQGFPTAKVQNVYLSNIRIDSAKNAISFVDTDNIIFKDVVIGEFATPPSYVK